MPEETIIDYNNLRTNSAVTSRRDGYGEEMSPHATIWQEYTNEADTHDQQLLKQWNQNIDTMLIVATLFSAVVTAFVIFTVQSLGPSAQDVTNALLQDIVQSLRYPQANTTQPNREIVFNISSTNVWVNGLWFISLACSLGAAAIGMLIKQWLAAYAAGLPSSHQVRARLRQRRYDALIKWKTPEIIGFLPFAISICIILFLLGLSIWLFSLNETIAIASTICIGCIVLFHIASFLLPAVCNCPWKTAISALIYQGLYPLRRVMTKFNLHYLRERFRAFELFIATSFLFIWSHIITVSTKRAGSFFLQCYRSLKTLFFHAWYFLAFVGEWSLKILLLVILVPSWCLIYPLVKPIDYIYQRTLQPVCSLCCKHYNYYSSKYILVYPSYLPTFGTTKKHVRKICAMISNQKTNKLSQLNNLPWRLPSEYDVEVHYVQEQLKSHWLDGQAILWMICTSTKKSIIEHSLQSLAGLSADFDNVNILQNLHQLVQSNLIVCLMAKNLSSVHIELYARALWQIQSNLSLRTGQHGRGSEEANHIQAYVKMTETLLQQDQSAFAACICACSMLNEITDLLQLICDENSPRLNGSPPLHIRIMVETLTQEISRRKKSDSSTWTVARSDNSLESRVVPLLVKLLRVKQVSIGRLGYDGPEPFDTSIAVALAIFTQAIPHINLAEYSAEEQRRKDIQYLICASLSMILRFPEHFNCQEIIDLVYDKLVLAGIELVGQPYRDDKHYHVITAEVFKAAFAPQKQPNHTILIALSQMDSRVYLQLHPTAISDSGRYFTNSFPMEVQIAVSTCLENLHVPLAHLGSLHGFGQDQELIDVVISSKSEMSSRVHAFQLLLKRAYESRDNNSQRKKMKYQGFFDAVKVFFSSIGAISQEDLHQWLTTLSVLCKHEANDLVKSGAIQSFIVWAYQDWRGRRMMEDQMEDLHKLAKLVSVNVEEINNTSWFSPESPTRHQIPRAV